MTAVLGTLPFLGTIWLLLVLGAAVLEESGARIGAALKGVPLSSGFPLFKARARRPRSAELMRFEERWRGAA
jgi:hypothetical protein